jgi:hypothetical protein
MTRPSLCFCYAVLQFRNGPERIVSTLLFHPGSRSRIGSAPEPFVAAVQQFSGYAELITLGCKLELGK